MGITRLTREIGYDAQFFDILFMVWCQPILFEKRDYLAKLGKEVTIREAKEEDFISIWNIFQKVVSEGEYTSAVRAEPSKDNDKHSNEGEDKEKFITVLCEIERQIVGYVTVEESMWKLSRHAGELGIAVLPQFRGVGVGSALLDSALTVASEKGFKKVNLSVFRTNKNAMNLYKRFGFKKVGEKKKQFYLNGSYIDEIIMEKFLEPL
jgi:ribosomal protein S18 acetylase RimI-like enzyme